MTVNANDITVTMNGRTMVFPDVSLLYSFVMHARFPVAQSNAALRIVDVGGCVGGFTLASMLNFPNSNFDVIEPWRACFPYLEQNLGHMPNVRLHRVAVSDKRKMLTLSLQANFTKMGQASAYGEGISAEQVNAVPLDDLIRGRVDVLKVDVEGYEYAVLEGAYRILREWHPSLLVEIKENHLQRAGHSKAKLIRYLTDLGYSTPEEIGYDYWFVWGEQ